MTAARNGTRFICTGTFEHSNLIVPWICRKRKPFRDMTLREGLDEVLKI